MYTRHHLQISLIFGRSGTQYVAIVIKLLSSNCGAHLEESYCKESNISDTNWPRYPFSIQNIDGTLIPTADMTKIKQNGIKDKIILNKIALYRAILFKIIWSFIPFYLILVISVVGISVPSIFCILKFLLIQVY